MLHLISDRVAEMNARDLTMVVVGVFLLFVVLGLAIHTGYALAMRDLLVIRERERSEIRTVSIQEHEPDS